MEPIEKVLTTAEAGTMFKGLITSRHIKRLIQSKLVIGRQAGSIWLVDESSLRDYLSNRPKPGRKSR